MQTCLLPITEQRQRIENCLGLWPSCQDYPSVPPTICTGLLLEPLLLQCCSPLRWSLPLPMRMCILGGNGGSLDTNLTSDQGGGSHCQLPCPCTHSKGSEASFRVESAITRASNRVHNWVGVGSAQWCGTNPSRLTQPLTKACTIGKNETSTEMQPQTEATTDCLYTWERPNYLRTPCSSPRAPTHPLIRQ